MGSAFPLGLVLLYATQFQKGFLQGGLLFERH